MNSMKNVTTVCMVIIIVIIISIIHILCALMFAAFLDQSEIRIFGYGQIQFKSVL